MAGAVPTSRKQFTALWLKQWRLTRRSYITCAWNILLPIVIMGAMLGLERFLNSQTAITRPATRYPAITPPWFIYESEANDSVFIPPATFFYSSADSNATDVGTFDPFGAGVLGAAYAPEAWVKFVEFDQESGAIQPKEILNRDFNVSFAATQIASESELISTLYTAYKARRPPSIVSAYSIREIDFAARRFAFDVFVNGSVSRYADLSTATALLDQGISLLLNATVPGVMRFLGYKTFPFLGGKVNELDIATGTGPFFYLILLSMLFAVFVNLIVYEKEKRLLVLMKMNGVRMSMWWLVNYVFCFALYVFVMLFFLISGYALRFRFFTQNSAGVLVVLLLLWGLALVSFAFAASTVFSRSRTAIIACYFWIILTALVANFLIDNWVRDIDDSQALANVVSLVPPWALYRGMVYIAMQTQERGPGVAFSDLDNPKMNIAACFGYLTFHAVFWLLLALYLEEVLPSEFGIKRHPLFFLRKAYWCGTGSDHRLPAYEPVAAEPATVAKERQATFNKADAAVRVLGLRKEYANGKVAVANAALSIEHGVCLGLLGSNGAGKTTLISMLCGLFPPSAGDATIDGLSILTDMTEIHRRIGVCPQMDVLWEDLTGAEHLYFFGRLKGLTGGELDDAVRTALEGVRLRPARHKLAKKYSGGMKRRLSVAISLIADPKVVFLDEPSTGLDPASRQTLWECIRRSKVGKAMVLTTHSMEEAEALCDRHAVFCDGSLRAVGLAAELKAMYAPSLRLAINLKRDTAVSRAAALDQFMSSTFPSARADSSKAIAEFRTYMLPFTARLSDIFSKVDGARASLGIADWAVSNATLEEVFFAVVRLARLVDVRRADGTWRPDDVATALAQYSSAPHVPPPPLCAEEAWGLALVAAYFTAQPEVEQSEWRDFSASLNEALRKNAVDPVRVAEARTALQASQLLFQG